MFGVFPGLTRLDWAAEWEFRQRSLNDRVVGRRRMEGEGALDSHLRLFPREQPIPRQIRVLQRHVLKLKSNIRGVARK